MFANASRIFVFAVAALSLGTAFAQSEPTLKQVYDAAQAGHVDQAQQMMAKVLRDHPTSAKAHYVEAELDARQGKLADARSELATAEKLAPGLPFAKPEAVQALRSQLLPTAVAERRSTALDIAPASPAPSFPWGFALAGAAGVGLLIVFLRRRNNAAMASPPAQYAAQPGMPYPGATGMAPGYGPAPAGGMGSGIMGGLATGLAVGAGVVAAEEIGRRMLGGDHARAAPQAASDAFIPIDQNPDMGGGNFGVNDAGSWDDGGSASDGGDGGGWDN